MTTNMGVSGKWIRALVGLKKQEKSKRSGEDGHVSFLIILLFSMQLSISHANFLVNFVDFSIILFENVINSFFALLFKVHLKYVDLCKIAYYVIRT